MIIQEGEKSTCFYILEKSAVLIYIDNTLLNLNMYLGSVFGEVAFASGKSSTRGDHCSQV